MTRGFGTESEPTAARYRAWFANAPRGQFWTYFCAAILFNFGFSVFFFLFNVYLYGVGLNERSLGLIGSCAAVGGLCGTIPAGIAGQRFGLRATLTGGILLAVLASVLRVCFVSQLAQLGLAFVSGVALCTWAVSLSPAVAGFTTERQRPFAFSLMFASGIGDAGVGAFAAGHLPGWFASAIHHALTATQAERAVLLIACGIAGLATFPIFRLRLRSPAPRTRLVRPSTPFLLRFLPAMAVWSLVTAAFPPFANVYFVHHLGVTLQSMGWILSIAQLLQFCAILLLPLILRRFRLATGVMITQLATAAALLSLATAHTALHAAWIYWAYTAVQFSNEPAIFSLLMDGVPAADRTGAASYTFFIASGASIIATSAVGVLIVRVGYSVMLGCIAALAVVAACLFRRLVTVPEGAAQQKLHSANSPSLAASPSQR